MHPRPQIAEEVTRNTELTVLIVKTVMKLNCLCLGSSWCNESSTNSSWFQAGCKFNMCERSRAKFTCPTESQGIFQQSTGCQS